MLPVLKICDLINNNNFVKIRYFSNLYSTIIIIYFFIKPNTLRIKYMKQNKIVEYENYSF